MIIVIWQSVCVRFPTYLRRPHVVGGGVLVLIILFDTTIAPNISTVNARVLSLHKIIPQFFSQLAM